MPLPPNLRNAVSRPGGGQVVLVIGAGCSIDEPTNLPLAGDLALRVHERLVNDGILNAASCSNPRDLSCVADAVWAAAHPHSQRELVDRLPLDEFRNAAPNDGYLLVAAMLREKAISCVISLNFDLAIAHALSALDARNDVAVIMGPEEHANLRAVNVIYLHRSAYASPDEWILRSDVIEDAWRGQWEEVIVRRFVASPVTVFVGLGSPATVLLESTAAIRAAIHEHVQVYQADPGPIGGSAFSDRLGVTEQEYMRMDWLTFTRELAQRLLIEHREALEGACARLLADNGWDAEAVGDLAQRIVEHGLVGLGRLRARWLLTGTAYVPSDGYNAVWLADLMLIVGMMERVTRSAAEFSLEGVVYFYRDDHFIGSIVLGHGSGSQRWLVLESRLKHHARFWRKGSPKPKYAVISGVTDASPVIATPNDLVSDVDVGSLVPGDSDDLQIFSVDQIRATPNIIDRILGA